MPIRIVRLGEPRAPGEGLRIGTVRRPPRGVPKAEYARRDYYDVWLPNLAPSAALMQEGLAAQASGDEATWKRFARGYRAEMKTPECAHLLDTLAALSHHASFAVGCYCADASRCHRSLLSELLAERGAQLK